MRNTITGFILLTGLLVLSGACQTKHSIEVAPVEVKPIHITIDVNLQIKKELDDFFDDIYGEDK